MAQHQHIFLPDIKSSIPYTSNVSRGPAVNIPERDRTSHSARLIHQFENIWESTQAERSRRQAISIRQREGTYLEFKSSAGFDLVTKSLEDIRQGVRLLNIRQKVEMD